MQQLVDNPIDHLFHYLFTGCLLPDSDEEPLGFVSADLGELFLHPADQRPDVLGPEPLHEFRDFHIPNCALNWFLHDGKGWHLEAWDDHHYLSDVLLDSVE